MDRSADLSKPFLFEHRPLGRFFIEYGVDFALEGGDEATIVALLPISRLVVRHTIEPAPNVLLRSALSQVPVQLYKDILNNILGFVGQ
jgi:hypothetical protein